ncbi:MAG TPA: hypothetical protein VLZ72_05870, partial [Flavobacterium sp.]|nr:hypothetical protein [Flavobacterium sp.]
ALRLEADKIILCDKDFFWIYIKSNGNFDRTQYIKHNWQELNDANIFNKVKKVIGKDFINS